MNYALSFGVPVFIKGPDQVMINEVTVPQSLPRLFCYILHMNVIYNQFRIYSSCLTTLSRLYLQPLKSRAYAKYLQGSVLP